MNEIKTNETKTKKENGIFSKFLELKFVKYVTKKFLKGLAYICVTLPHRVRVKGKENLPQGPYIIVANHVSAIDPFFMITNISDNIRFISKNSITKYWWGRLVGYAFDIIFIKRDGRDMSGIKQMYSVLEKGDVLGIFPEGTRHGIQKGKNFKSTIISIAVKKDVPIVPIGITGEVKLFNKTELNIGKPLYFNKLSLEVIDGDIKELGSLMQQEVLELVDSKYYAENRIENKSFKNMRKKYGEIY